MTFRFSPTATLPASAIVAGETTWRSPSNIALVKYWGKHGVQLPSNPSISFTLDECHTTTTLKWFPKTGEELNINCWLDGEEAPSFIPKIKQFFERVQDGFPFLDQFRFEIHTSNSFPHSSGIASSASGMSALALCLCSMEKELTGSDGAIDFVKASYLARLGSGSACRSLFPELAVWGEHAAYAGSHDEWAVASQDHHEVFNTYQDTILIVDKGKKHVSSTAGHALMHGHPFAAQRFDFAGTHLHELNKVLQAGDLETFNAIVEREALMLHAMMMTSSPYYLLFKPNTLEIIQKVWEFRQETKSNFTITLDAGANVHLVYPLEHSSLAERLINDELLVYCQNQQYICDKVGLGPCQITTDI